MRSIEGIKSEKKPFNKERVLKDELDCIKALEELKGDYGDLIEKHRRLYNDILNDRLDWQEVNNKAGTGGYTPKVRTKYKFSCNYV